MQPSDKSIWTTSASAKSAPDRCRERGTHEVRLLHPELNLDGDALVDAVMSVVDFVAAYPTDRIARASV